MDEDGLNSVAEQDFWERALIAMAAAIVARGEAYRPAKVAEHASELADALLGAQLKAIQDRADQGWG